MSKDTRNGFESFKQNWVITSVGTQDAASLARVHDRLFAKSWPETEFESLLSGTGCLGVAVWSEPSDPCPQKGASQETCQSADQMKMVSEGDDPIGICVLRTVAGVAEVITFGVVEDARRYGLGKALLADAMGRAAKSGCQRAILEVAEDNEAARGLYSGLGFAQVGRRAGYYRLANGRRVNALVLSKQIG